MSDPQGETQGLSDWQLHAIHDHGQQVADVLTDGCNDFLLKRWHELAHHPWKRLSHAHDEHTARRLGVPVLAVPLTLTEKREATHG